MRWWFTFVSFLLYDLDMTFEETLYQFIAAIPSGTVATYGQLARLAGRPSSARWVGRSLKHLPKDSSLPWHRVINAQGKISFPKESELWLVQKDKLADDGVLLHNGRIRLKDYQWQC
jgi:methylated-DNA-protein-cysteine methyltransferase-like protein